MAVIQRDDGKTGCFWTGDLPEYQAYHDTEWGYPVTDDRHLFEKLVLEGFQSGLSWLTILRKRENFRDAFDNFSIEKVASFSPETVENLMTNAGIIRHRGKITAAINNAERALALREECGSLQNYFWAYGDSKTKSQEQTTSPAAISLSKDLKKRGWKFIGPTTAYAFLQSMGIVNDHDPQCFRHDHAEELRQQVLSPEKK